MNAGRIAPKKYDVVVVGMGPVGLAAAYEAAKKGNKVLIIEKRPENESVLRSQFVVLDPNRKYQLMKMISVDDTLDEADIKFLDTLAGSAEIRITAIQRFILNRIKRLQGVTRQYETTLTSVDLSKGNAALQSGNRSELIEFNHLVAADGVKSETLGLVNERLKENQGIRKSTPFGMKHLERTYHLGAYVKLSRVDGAELILPEKEFVSSFMENKRPGKMFKSHQLYFLRFDPRSHQKSGKKSVKLGFIGEVTKELYKQYQDTQDKQLALDYTKRAAAEYLGIDPNQLKVEIIPSRKTPAKDRLKVLAFQGNSQKADKAATQVNGHGFYLVGDAYFTPQYPLGHGLNDGLEAASMLGSLPKKTEQNAELFQHLSRYNKLNASNVRFIRIVMQVIRWFRKLGNIRMKIAKTLERAVDKREKGDKVDLKSSLSHTIDTKKKLKEDPVEKFLYKKFSADQLMLFHTDPELKLDDGSKNKIDDQLKTKIEEWNQFLMNNPSIAKQYRAEIWDHLIKIQKLIEEHRHPIQETTQKEFSEMLRKYKIKIDEYNHELIVMAESGPNKMDSSSRTPLYHAVQHADTETIRNILELGASPNKAARKTIFTARVLDHPEIARVLLSYGADPFKPIIPSIEANGRESRRSLFFFSFFSENLYFNPKFVVECLIACKDPQSPLYQAAQSALSDESIAMIQDQLLKNPSQWSSKLGYHYIKDALRSFGVDDKVDDKNKSLQSIIDTHQKLRDCITATLEMHRQAIASQKTRKPGVISSALFFSRRKRTTNDTQFVRTPPKQKTRKT